MADTEGWVCLEEVQALCAQYCPIECAMKVPSHLASWSFQVPKNLTSNELTVLVAAHEERYRRVCAELCCVYHHESPAWETSRPPTACCNSSPTMSTIATIIDLPESQENTAMVIDIFLKQAHFVACSSLPSARKLGKLFVVHVYWLHRIPQLDNFQPGVQFTTMFWCKFLAKVGSKQGLSLAFHSSHKWGS